MRLEVTLNPFDVVIVGAGAAGMMCAIEAGKRGRSVLVIDHASAPGEKIRISGGGRCNFTNIHASPANFLSQNPKFCVSALRRYTPRDFIAMVDRHRIAWHEKTLGQLFCDDSARQIIRMLLDEMEAVGAELRLQTSVDRVTKTDAGFELAIGGSEGYRTAEVTLGGVDTRALNSRTMAAETVEGLYFIGEAVDVTGWLGGFNFQWAWASGWCAGQAV